MTPLLRTCVLALLAAALALGGCASAPPASAPPRQPDPLPPPVKLQEASPKERAKLHADLGAGYYERGRMDVALEELNEAVKLDPDDARIYNLYGLVYAMLGENAKAEQNFQRALAMAPQDSDIHHNWGWYLCSNGRPRESIPEFEKALANPLYKTPETALINAGRCSIAIGDLNGADNFFRRAHSRRTEQPAGDLRARADLVQAGSPGRGADVGPPPDAAAAGAARSALSRDVHREEDRRPQRRAIVHIAVEEPLSGFGRNEGDPHRNMRVTERDAMARPDARETQPERAGSLLRVARESAGMSIDAVAQHLKLAPRQVKALEDGDYSHLPGRTFVRGFVRNYARLVHLDAERVLSALPGGTAAPALEAPTLHPTAQTMGELPTTDHSRTPWSRWAIPLVLAAIVAAAAIYEWMRPAGESPAVAQKDVAPAPVTPRSFRARCRAAGAERRGDAATQSARAAARRRTESAPAANADSASAAPRAAANAAAPARRGRDRRCAGRCACRRRTDRDRRVSQVLVDRNSRPRRAAAAHGNPSGRHDANRVGHAAARRHDR